MAKALTERSKPSRGAGARDGQDAGNPRRQRLWRDLALIVIAPLLLYLLACLVSYSPDDPSGSNSGSVTGHVHNLGGLAGAWIADLLFQLTDEELSSTTALFKDESVKTSLLQSYIFIAIELADGQHQRRSGSRLVG